MLHISYVQIFNSGFHFFILDAPQNITAEKNEVYGTAAFALAGLEVARYARENQ